MREKVVLKDLWKKPLPSTSGSMVFSPAEKILARMEQVKMSNIFSCSNESKSNQGECSIAKPHIQVKKENIKTDINQAVCSPVCMLRDVDHFTNIDHLGDINKPVQNVGDFSYFVNNDNENSVSVKKFALSKRWIPAANFKFPKDKNNLSFRQEWAGESLWLAYSSSEDGMYCVICVLSESCTSKHNGNKASVFVKKPFRDWKHALQRIRVHNEPRCHHYSSVDYTQFKRLHIEQTDISIERKLNKILDEQVQANREKLRYILECVLYLAKQCVAFKGHLEDSKYLDDPSGSCGNFQELLLLLIRCGNTVMEDHFKNAAKNAIYRSKTIQDEIIRRAGTLVRAKLVDEIKDAVFFLLWQMKLLTSVSKNNCLLYFVLLMEKGRSEKSLLVSYIVMKEQVDKQLLIIFFTNLMSWALIS